MCVSVIVGNHLSISAYVGQQLMVLIMKIEYRRFPRKLYFQILTFRIFEANVINQTLPCQTVLHEKDLLHIDLIGVRSNPKVHNMSLMAELSAL